MNLTVQSALFYVKFKAIAPKLKELVSEIEKRCPVHREYVIISYTFYCFLSFRLCAGTAVRRFEKERTGLPGRERKVEIIEPGFEYSDYGVEIQHGKVVS